jgi:hypothetical protein
LSISESFAASRISGGKTIGCISLAVTWKSL